MKKNKLFVFNGTMLASPGEIIFQGRRSSVVGFQQTDTIRNIGEEYPDIKIDPDIMFVFKSIESIDSVITVLNIVRNNFIDIPEIKENKNDEKQE